MKKLSVFLAALLLFAVFGLSSAAAYDDVAYLPVVGTGASRLIDEAQLLSGSEQTKLLSILDEISERRHFDVVVATANWTAYEEPEDSACDIYESHGFGYGGTRDGAILLLDMGERTWAIIAEGRGEYAVNNSAINLIGNTIVGDLSAGDYYTAFATFADFCDELVEMYDSGETYKAPFRFPVNAIAALAVGLIVALIYVSSLKKKLKSVHFETGAMNYIVDGSLKVTQANERFLYKNVSRTARQTSSSSGSRGGGGFSSHSGGHGRF